MTDPPPMRRTKIVCTIGPASRQPAALEGLVAAGMNVARLNFSHGTQAEHGENIARIRRIAEARGAPIAILQDLAGPKIRIGAIAAGTVQLEPGRRFTLTSRDVPGDAREVSVSLETLPRQVRPGDTLLLADGAIELQVREATERDIVCEVLTGGAVSSHKGINVPTRSIDLPGLTDKDRADLAFGIAQEVDFVAVSFVRCAADVAQVRRLLQDAGSDIPLIAKIEKHEALEHIGEIVDAVEGIMVARGDLGVEIPLERVPVVQKDLIARANRVGKIVITATQMLRSMVDSPRPTRAEVTDVANAVYDGTDAVMLSEETAIGHYPREAVTMMARIAEDAEAAVAAADRTRRLDRQDDRFPPSEAVVRAACRLAEHVGAAAIIANTTSGSTARLVAKARPRMPILAPTFHEPIFRQLALVWGTHPLHMPLERETDSLIATACRVALDSGVVRPGDRVVVTAGVPVNVTGTTNLIRLIELETE